MRRLLTFFIVFMVLSCAHSRISPKSTIKPAPEHTSEITDPELIALVGEYKRLSAQYNVVFNKTVTIGFKDIDQGSVVGQCTYGRGFREIDLDKKFWDRASWKNKITVVFHEMTHCNCTRVEHDYGPEKLYPDTTLNEILDIVNYKVPFYKAEEGFFDDGCPLSIMYPYVLYEGCLDLHYAQYVKEMFDRCQPY